MREIKFRGKRLDNDEFVYGFLTASLCRRGGYNYIIVVPAGELDEEDKEYIVDYRTIGQFTGLKDKSATDSYNGDIVDWIFNDGAIRCVLDWSEYHARFYLKPIDPEYGTFHEIHGAHVFEIVGNISQNPELLNH